MLGGRQRSSSKEFILPPLQDFDDHGDQANQKDQKYNNMLDNYKSNEKPQKILSVDHDLSAIAQLDEQDYSPRNQKKRNSQLSARSLDLDDVDINLDDSDEMDNRIDLDKLNVVDNDLINAYDDFANTLNHDIDNKENMA